MSTITAETFSENREPQWLVESPIKVQSHFDRRGCVRQIRTSVYRGDRNVHTPGRDGNLPQSTTNPSTATSGMNADRQAHWYDAAPATHRSADRPTFSTTVGNIPIVEFRVPLCCGKCEEKVMEELENVKGVYKVVSDLHSQRVIVSSTVDPGRLLKRIKRVKKNSRLLSSSSRTGNTHVTPTFPCDAHSHPHFSISAYKPATEGHTSASRLANQHRSSELLYTSPIGSMGAQYLRRSPGSHEEDPQFNDAEFKSASPHYSSFNASLNESQRYTTGTPYVVNVTDGFLHHDHLWSSYVPAYEYSEDYVSLEYY